MLVVYQSTNRSHFNSIHADANVCDTCRANVTYAAANVTGNGTITNAANLFDGVTTTVGYTASVLNPYIRVALNRTYDTISHITIVSDSSSSYPGKAAGVNVWLSATADFASGVKCAENFTPVSTNNVSNTVYCAPTPGINFVTIERPTTVSDTLYIAELKIEYRPTCERHSLACSACSMPVTLTTSC